jgi:hypothetical protein
MEGLGVTNGRTDMETFRIVGRQQARRLERGRCRDDVMPGWRSARDLKIGDSVMTDYECGYGVGGNLKTVTVTGRIEDSASQSGVMFQVAPALKNNPPDAWFDADWFAPVTPNV